MENMKFEILEVRDDINKGENLKSDVCAGCMGNRISGQNGWNENGVELNQQFAILNYLSTLFHAHGSWICSFVLLPKLKEYAKCLYIVYPTASNLWRTFFSRFSELKIGERLNFAVLFFPLFEKSLKRNFPLRTSGVTKKKYWILLTRKNCRFVPEKSFKHM